MNNKELIKAGHALAKAISNDTPLIEIAKIVSNLATQLDVQLARSNQLSIALEAAEKRIAELEMLPFNPALLGVISERQRQQSVEGWTPEHDDQYGESQLLWASSCYVLNTIQPFNRIPMDWPWAPEWWKPTNPRRDLVKAGALILAEIERIDRQEAAQ
ncbi:hypothetical protein [Enterobacter asburiae]